MLTFRGVLETASGLYRCEKNGKGYMRDELLATLPSDVLALHVGLKKVEAGVYAIKVDDPEQTVYHLFSRRRRARVDGEPADPAGVQ